MEMDSLLQKIKQRQEFGMKEKNYIGNDFRINFLLNLLLK